MTRDLTQHPAFREAVEAAFHAGGCGAFPGVPMTCTRDTCDCFAYELTEQQLAAALPFLERLYRETCAEELQQRKPVNEGMHFTFGYEHAIDLLRRTDA